MRALDKIRLFSSVEGLAVLLTSILYAKDIHQTTTYTTTNRYPTLFDFAARTAPAAQRILSFGCATGEEIISLRERFPASEIVGVEINPWCRRIAAQRLARDPRIRIIARLPDDERFDLIFALAVLQREPHRILETDTRNISRHYPFARFDAAVARLRALLKPAGLLLVDHSQYRVEDSAASVHLQPVPGSPPAHGPFFSPDGRRDDIATALTAFRKAGSAP